MMARTVRVASVLILAVVVARCGATAPSCTYVVTPGAVLASGGDVASIMVSTGSTCSWTAASNASWIAIFLNSPTRTGSGAVQIVAGPNTRAAPSGAPADPGENA